MFTKWIIKRQLKHYEVELLSLELALEYAHVDEKEVPSLLATHAECRTIYDGLKLLLEKVSK